MTRQKGFCANIKCKYHRSYNDGTGTLRVVPMGKVPNLAMQTVYDSHQPIMFITVKGEMFHRRFAPPVQLCEDCAAVAKALLLNVF